MHSNQTYNIITIDNPEILPFPDEIKEILKTHDWANHFWNVFGLPAHNSAFGLTDKQLYFERDEFDKANLRKEDFTGQAMVSGVIVPKTGESIYLLCFEFTFFKGILQEIERKDFLEQPKKQYEEGYNQFVKQNNKTIKTVESWWFRWLYVPYYHLLTWITLCVTFIITFILKIFIYLIDKLLPIKL